MYNVLSPLAVKKNAKCLAAAGALDTMISLRKVHTKYKSAYTDIFYSPVSNPSIINIIIIDGL